MRNSFKDPHPDADQAGRILAVLLGTGAICTAIPSTRQSTAAVCFFKLLAVDTIRYHSGAANPMKFLQHHLPHPVGLWSSATVAQHRRPDSNMESLRVCQPSMLLHLPSLQRNTSHVLPLQQLPDDQPSHLCLARHLQAFRICQSTFGTIRPTILAPV